jgi:hypothetical protein
MMNKTEMLNHIDAKAGYVRSRYIMIAPGQEATYILKSRQAQAFKDAGYTGTPGGLLQAEMYATNESAQIACDRILAEENAWAGLAAMIESVRRSAKVQITAAATDEDAEAVLQAALAQFGQML